MWLKKWCIDDSPIEILYKNTSHSQKSQLEGGIAWLIVVLLIFFHHLVNEKLFFFFFFKFFHKSFGKSSFVDYKYGTIHFQIAS